MEDYHIMDGQILIACDGLLALWNAQALHITDPNEAHYDLISAIWSLRQLLPHHITFQHIKGHQDGGQIMVLPYVASWMNIEMDNYAKWKVSVDRPHEQLEGTPYKGWICSIKGRRITKHLSEALWKHLNGSPILNHHWAMKQCYWPGTEKLIDWDMVARAMHALPRAKQKWVSAKFLPYGTNKTWWNLGLQAKCPCCLCPKEDKEHILHCLADSAVSEWQSHMNSWTTRWRQWKLTPSSDKIFLQDYNNGMIMIQAIERV